MIVMEIRSDNLLGVQLPQDGKTAQPSAKQGIKPDNGSAAALDSGFEAILRQALQPVNDRQIIEKATLDLKDGRLESEAAFEQAAENLFKYGL